MTFKAHDSFQGRGNNVGMQPCQIPTNLTIFLNIQQNSSTKSPNVMTHMDLSNATSFTHEFPKQHWVPLLPLLIYQHLNYGNKFYNFWKWKMGALIEIKCKIFNFQKEMHHAHTIGMACQGK
jgi:hypothetical protein